MSPRLTGAAILLALAFLAPNATTAQNQPGKRPIGVDDVVEMTRLIDPNVALSGMIPLPVKLAPNGRHFVIATQRGDLSTGENIYRLTLYDTVESLAHINGETGRPLGKDVLVTRSAANLEAISNVRWLDEGQTLAFTAALDGRAHQAFTFDIFRWQLTQLTRHPRRVQDFQLSADGGRIAYAGTVLNRNEDWDKPSFPLLTRTVHEIVQHGRDNIVPRYHVYVSRPGANTPPTDIDVHLGNNSFPPLFRLSPDGRRMVVLTDMPLTEKWREKLVVKAPGSLNATPDRCPTDPDRFCWPQFMLIDLESGDRRPLTDTPVGSRIGGAWDIVWLDENRVAISNIMPPVKGTVTDGGAVMEVDIRSGRSSIVTPLAPHAGIGMLSGLGKRGADALELVFHDYVQGQSRHLIFQRKDGQWREQQSQPSTSPPPPLRLWLAQGFNQPPEIAGEDTQTGRQAVLTDLNPQIAELSLGHAEKVQWRDAAGREWEANLTLPVNYQAGTRYPLVIQTHGYYRDIFVADGPSPGPHAAQPLAGQGMVVVQMGGKREGFGTRGELLVNQQGIEALIDTLNKRGLIDATRIGLIGWSGLGMTVDHMMVHSRWPIKAATSADGDSTSMVGYGAQVNRGGGVELLHYYEGVVDSHPWGDGLPTWTANAPVFNLDRTKTALLIEQLGGYFLSAYWDSYAILRRLNKPVEWIIYPDGTHVLVKPWERQASMQINVDWYRFWLKGEEDADPAKAVQYARWRTMRDTVAVPE